MSLAEAAEARKARLHALRKRKLGENGQEAVNGEEPPLKQRAFDPETRALRRHGDVDEEDTVEKNVDGLAQLIIQEDEEKRAEDLDLFNIAPKRPNWDLKRELEKKLAKLERKTQEAIHTLIRQRLQSQKGGTADLSLSMAAENGTTAQDNSDEEE
ncbi:mRNA splicing factor [Dacryopinax primogenitus]|uniref:mRNA splicing factor n=1 Tax=Dacryopinax primogenitus (strain DJM 731) TaxID=1858805 RepID=M5GGJ7_DACPD|nr:mRNA splicing factor [Dacryopinax primogenitus]EJU05608.1 mRNA splicing factor [Dacryopinax primogenitus]